MPNTRRRRFSVQNDIIGRDPAKLQNGQHSSNMETGSHQCPTSQNSVPKKPKSKNKIYPNVSKISTQLEIVAECESSTSIMMIKKKSTTSIDKDVTVCSMDIDLFNLMGDLNSPEPIDEVVHNGKTTPQRDTDQARSTNRDGTTRRDKYPRQHRVKVRSPKRRVLVTDRPKIDDDSKQSIGINAIDWDQEIEVYTYEEPTNTLNETTEDVEIPSNHSIEDMCRICHSGDALSPELGQLVSACSCRGTVGRVHVKCLERWLTESGKSRCELCGTRYAAKRVHRYGVPKALVMWILSQNAKQLMVDSLGIMLMSPLAVLAAWLSGRTLAGIMSQDSHVPPWPLASTFVLACMTLVCYYCWIVSAATRHALGWWIWYRSHYEVRLQLQENEE